VLGGVKPDKLCLILDGPDDGLAARLLWVWPDTVAAFTLARDRGDEADARTAFARLADLSMGSDAAGHPEPIRLRLAREAEDALEEFGRDMGQRGEEASGPMAGALGKAWGHALRLAIVLEYLWWCASSNARETAAVSARAVLAAAGLLDGYFLPMAERSFGDAAIPVQERTARALARYLRRHRVRTFNARTMRREMGGPVREASAMSAACAELVDAGLIRPRPSRAGERGGRPTSDYDVNPAVHGSAT
jgi:hypothetical protein